MHADQLGIAGALAYPDCSRHVSVICVISIHHHIYQCGRIILLLFCWGSRARNPVD